MSEIYKISEEEWTDYVGRFESYVGSDYDWIMHASDDGLGFMAIQTLDSGRGKSPKRKVDVVVPGVGMVDVRCSDIKTSHADEVDGGQTTAGIIVGVGAPGIGFAASYLWGLDKKAYRQEDAVDAEPVGKGGSSLRKQLVLRLSLLSSAELIMHELVGPRWLEREEAERVARHLVRNHIHKLVSQQHPRGLRSEWGEQPRNSIDSALLN